MHYILRFLFVFLAVALANATQGPIQLNKDNFFKYVSGPDHVLVRFYAPWCGHCSAMSPAYRQLAEYFTGHPAVLIAEFNGDQDPSFMDQFGVYGYPTLKYFRPGSRVAEEARCGRDFNSMRQFMQSVSQKDKGKKGILQQDQKANGEVVVLTDKTFDKIVMNKSKAVLVDFYAPWCGHCKTLAPTYELLAETFANTFVIIAKIDADKHGAVAEKYKIDGYPTIRMYPKDKKPVEYSGPHDLGYLIKFVNEQAGIKMPPGGSNKSRMGLLPEARRKVCDYFTATDDKERERALREMAKIAKDLRD